MTQCTSRACLLRAPLGLGVLGALLLLVGGVGCQTPPPYTPPPLPAFLDERVALSVPPRPPEQVRAESKHPADPTHDAVVAGPAHLGQAQPAEAVTLPQAIEETIFANLRVKAGAEKVQQARGDLVTASLLPNPVLYADSILNPLPGARPFRPWMQGGPPQVDLAVNLPIDWFVFGKRVAAMEAKRLGVDVAAAEFADLVRQKVSDTVITFYDLLEAKALLELQRKDLEALQQIEEIVKKQVEAGGVGPIEVDRVRLAVLDSQRELRRRELLVATTRTRLRPLLGRKAPEPGFDVRGELTVSATAEPIGLEAAMELAQKNRPDLVALVRGIKMAEADLVLERRKAWPTVTVQPWFTYQFQKTTIGYPDARSWGGAMTASLPVSDRNQGNIEKALSARYEAMKNLQAQLADVRAEVEQAVETYQMAVKIIGADEPSLETGRRVRDAMVAAYQAGNRRLLDVLDAQRAYRERQRLSISARADYWRALYRLNAAVGGRALDCDAAPAAKEEQLPNAPTPVPQEKDGGPKANPAPEEVSLPELEAPVDQPPPALLGLPRGALPEAVAEDANRLRGH